MKTLHWHTEANPCLLAGHPVTPESWIGGVVNQVYRGYEIARRLSHKQVCNGIPGINGASLSAYSPVYPPRGFGGLSEAMLWDVMAGADVFPCDTGSGVYVYPDRVIRLIPPDRQPPDYLPVEVDAPALILALQNALVLQRRLEVTE